MVAAAVGVGSAVAGVAGSAMSSSAAGKASNAQQRAAQEANDLERELYEKNTANFQPYLDAGNTGLQALLYRMGLAGPGGQGAYKTADQLREELLPQYSTAATSGNPPDLRSLLTNASARAYSSAEWGFDPAKQQWGYKLTYPNEDGGPAWANTRWVYADPQGAKPERVDEAGLQAAINARLAEQDKQRAAQASDPNFGFLLKRFSDTNWQADPGYQFRLDQGNKALQNMAAMTGNLNSGRALKDAIGYNSGMASQEYGNAYNRFNTDQTNIYNKLAALAGMGQSSASSLAGVSQNYGAQVGNNLAQGANASAAGTIGQANAWNQGIGTAANALGGYAMGRGSGYSGTFQPTAGVGGLGAGQGVNGWW